MASSKNITLSWQATVVIIAVFAIPLILIPLFVPDSSKELDLGCASAALVIFAIAALAVRSRLNAKDNLARRKEILKQGTIGLSLVAAAIALGIISWLFGSFKMFGDYWFIAPTGLYGGGFAMIAKAMS